MVAMVKGPQENTQFLGWSRYHWICVYGKIHTHTWALVAKIYHLEVQVALGLLFDLNMIGSFKGTPPHPNSQLPLQDRFSS